MLAPRIESAGANVRLADVVQDEHRVGRLTGQFNDGRQLLMGNAEVEGKASLAEAPHALNKLLACGEAWIIFALDQASETLESWMISLVFEKGLELVSALDGCPSNNRSHRPDAVGHRQEPVRFLQRPRLIDISLHGYRLDDTGAGDDTLVVAQQVVPVDRRHLLQPTVAEPTSVPQVVVGIYDILHGPHLSRGGKCVSVADLPMVNAALNCLSTVLLLLGYIRIRQRQRRQHQRFMVAAVITSALFLGSYLVYHANVGSVAYPLQDWTRTLYLAILVPHIMLAALMVPFIVVALYHAARHQFDRHARLTRWVWPVWMFVSVSGVIIYWMLYHYAGATSTVTSVEGAVG